ncbi:TonB-dependent receptor domain-containing protein [Sphingomicrobium lutaoense]|uniref:Outer membrane receptor protein involved in Fe transport n=1 Tax=Sphingomicrobium lutaoense TaxID=515949 RepID=A0A839Z4Z2_9SPHN|nr:TonB-dependent receptor [Sphingomicrobium lutaoense]MBB3764943.1 outer membrane receptor protein involved in Fe transport [Sphingomicrobium lutaoense]
MKYFGLSSAAPIAIAVACLSQPAHAQAAPQEEAGQDVVATPLDEGSDQVVDETIVITGTRLSRDPNQAAPSPISSVSVEDIRSTGQVDSAELLRELPALSNSGTIADSLERGEGGIGQATLNLRGLGSGRTLVVVNGKRHVSGVAGSQIVDVATIPPALIQRVDVLTGGASAVYGADAVSGVVNYVLQDDFEGFDISGQVGNSRHSDGFTALINAVMGSSFADDRGNITLAGGYARIDELQMGDRAYTRDNGRFNTGQTYPNPLRRFQKGDISASATPNFFGYFNTANGLFPYGFSIPLPGTAAYDAIFTGGTTPTAEEQRLIDQALGAPSLAFRSGPVFAISSNSGLVFRRDFGFFDADINNNGINDCEESFIGFTGFGGGGCYVTTPDGGVRIFEDGIIASSSNQFGGDGAAERYDADSLIPQNDRYYANLLASFEVAAGAELFVDAKYVKSKTRSQSPYNTFYDSLLILPDNPFIPAVLQADADDAGGLRVSRDFIDLGPGATTAERDTYRIVGGLRGEMGNGWDYEVYGNYGRTESDVTFSNSVLYDRLFAALDAVDEGEFLNGTPNGNIVCRSDLDPTAVYPGSQFFPVIEGGFFTFNPGDGSCTPISIFNGAFSVSQAGVDFITTPTTNSSTLEQLVFGASLVGDTGSFLNLPGGAVGFVLGAEYREEKSDTRFDPLTLGILPVTTPFGNAGDFVGDISGNQSLVFDAQTRTFDAGGKYDVKEVYGELRLPILADMPFANQLEVGGAARYSDYSNIGGTFTWNVNGIYAPVEDLKLRGTYARAVRAPNINELFSPDQGTVFRPADPCDLAQINALLAADPAAGALRRDNCYAELGVLGFDSVTNPYLDPLTARFSGTTGGNPDLDEETATTWTVGAVLQPRFIPGLVITADYYDIVIEDAISAVSAQDIVDSCYDASDFPNQFCGLFDRQTDLGSPILGGFTFLRQRQLNFGRIETAGVDATIGYNFDLGMNEFALRATANWVDKIDFFFDPTDLSVVDPELREQGRPEWSGSGSVTWTRGDFSLGYRLQYIGSQAIGGVEIETADVVAGPEGFADEKFVHDLSFNFDVAEDMSIYGGVNNFTDVDPYPTNSAYPVSPYGRYYFLGFRISGDRLPF